MESLNNDMLPPGLHTPRQVSQYYDKKYFALINSGQAHPFIYPWASAGALLVIVYLLLDHRRSPLLRHCRYAVFIALCGFQGWCLFTNVANDPAASFGLGLLSAWGCLWVSAVMIFNDCQTDFQRIDRRDGDSAEASSKTGESIAMSNDRSLSSGASQLRRRTQEVDIAPTPDGGRLYWQSYPSGSLSERIDWVADVFCSFRGVGWTFQGTGVPPPPQWAQAQLNGVGDVKPVPEQPTVSRSGVRRYSDRKALLQTCLRSLAVGYLTLDLIGTIMHLDPYFLGYTNSAAPDHIRMILGDSYILTKTYRLLLSLAGISTALWAIFKLGPVFFCGIVGTKYIGVRGEPWMNPADQYGSFSLVLDKGLAGWWGGFWHQTFRFAFEAPGVRLLEALRIDKKSQIGKAIALFVAFFLSGCLHASGSYSQLGDTRPLRGPMCFFLLQAVGILTQTTVAAWLKKAGLTQPCPKLMLQVTNFLFVLVWLYHTAPLLVDDFAQGGVWLFEPVPFSPFRGMGFGAPDDGFFCWKGLPRWSTGKHWWHYGIAL